MINCEKINIKIGSKGEIVTEIQKYLKYLGYYDGKIDGNCGEYTVTAIKKLQKEYNLKIDGNFGPLTCKASGINGKDISSTNITIDIGTWKNIMKRYNEYVQKNKKEPNICYINIQNKYQYITNSKYKDIKSRYDKYIQINKKEPNFCYINLPKTNSNTNSNSNNNSNTTIFTSSPHYVSKGCNKLGQCNSYNCGPHSLRQCLAKFNIDNYSELTLAGYAGTTTAGTSHGGLNTALAQIRKKTGKNITITWKKFSDFGNTTSERFKNLGKLISQNNTDAIVHSLYRNKWGHYEVIKSINTKTNTVEVLNSLGSRCNSPGYCGYIETRSFNVFASYISNTPGGQPSIGLIIKQ